MDQKIHVCSLVAWVLWGAGMIGFLLISFGVVDMRHSGLALASVIGGSTFYVRILVRVQRKREDAAFEMGRLAAGGEQRSHLHRVR